MCDDTLENFKKVKTLIFCNFYDILKRFFKRQGRIK
ncbi:hypothetical protein N404_02040 [Helicobacter pylori FD506]|nr:hypothetical protein N404_02040 [Helicobacter pylori FD506]